LIKIKLKILIYPNIYWSLAPNQKYLPSLDHNKRNDKRRERNEMGRSGHGVATFASVCGPVVRETQDPARPPDQQGLSVTFALDLCVPAGLNGKI
jgi:hypothetical protein